MKGNLIIISSPSGGGKGTLIKEILRSVPSIGYSVSHTTRAPREGEVNGRDYFFVTREEFETRIANGEFLEFAEVHGNFYGTSLKRVQEETDTGRDIILEIDVQGAAIVIDRFPEAVSIFILPPSYEVLRDRLIARGTETSDSLELRLANSVGEIERFEEFQYVIINNSLEKAVIDLASVIVAERLKRDRQKAAIRRILNSFDTPDEAHAAPGTQE
jgi:guanylate kinase